MKTGIVSIGGFTETNREASGMDGIQRRVEVAYDDAAEVYDLRPWKVDVKGLAALLVRDGIDRAVLLAYSWGGGYAAPRLCRELIRRGIVVELVLLCDPVYRPQWLPTWGLANVFGFRALIPGWPVIKFPHAVKRIDGIRQEATTPRGHRIQHGYFEPRKLRCIRRIGMAHTTIDQSPEWEALVLKELQTVFET